MKLREAYYIVGEGITEKYYFQHLKKIKKYNVFVRPRFFPKKNSLYYLEKLTKDLLAGGVKVICVFDSDNAKRNKEESERFKNFIKKYKNNVDVIICDSYPSIEFWFLLHFKQTNKVFLNFKSLRKELMKFIPGYNKTVKFLEKDVWVKLLIQNQLSAMKNAKSIELGGAYSNIYKAIEILEN